MAEWQAGFPDVLIAVEGRVVARCRDVDVYRRLFGQSEAWSGDPVGFRQLTETRVA